MPHPFMPRQPTDCPPFRELGTGPASSNGYRTVSIQQPVTRGGLPQMPTLAHNLSMIRSTIYEFSVRPAFQYLANASVTRADRYLFLYPNRTQSSNQPRLPHSTRSYLAPSRSLEYPGGATLKTRLGTGPRYDVGYAILVDNGARLTADTPALTLTIPCVLH